MNNIKIDKLFELLKNDNINELQLKFDDCKILKLDKKDIKELKTLLGKKNLKRYKNGGEIYG